MQGFITRHRPSPSMAVALLALGVALGGTSYAAITLPKNSVTSKQIKNGQVKGKDIGKNAVTSRKVKDFSLLAQDFKADQLPAGPKGDKGDKGDLGPSNVIVRTHDSTVVLDPAPGPDTNQTIVTMAGIPAGAYEFSAKTDAVNFSSPDFVRCAIVADSTQIGATTTRVGAGSGASLVASLPVIGGYQSATSFTARLRCSHDTGMAGISVESSRLIATAVGAIDIAAG
jgi:hypothetical protein